MEMGRVIRRVSSSHLQFSDWKLRPKEKKRLVQGHPGKQQGQQERSKSCRVIKGSWCCPVRSPGKMASGLPKPTVTAYMLLEAARCHSCIYSSRRAQWVYSVHLVTRKAVSPQRLLHQRWEWGEFQWFSALWILSPPPSASSPWLGCSFISHLYSYSTCPLFERCWAQPTKSSNK